jgi:hypothetical protein
MYLPRVTHSSSHLLLLLLAVSSWWPPRAAAFVQQAGASTRQLSQWGNNVRAVGSSRVAATAGAQVSARWLEGNSWMFNIGGVNVLLDPLFVSDFHSALNAEDVIAELKLIIHMMYFSLQYRAPSILACQHYTLAIKLF